MKRSQKSRGTDIIEMLAFFAFIFNVFICGVFVGYLFFQIASFAR